MNTAKCAVPDRKEMSSMLVFGVLVFAIVTFFVSFLIGRTGEFDKGKVATYITLIAWGSMTFGLYIGRIAPQ